MRKKTTRRSRRVGRFDLGDDYDKALKKIALLAGEGVPQKEMAEMLSLSPSRIWQLVDVAKKKGYIEQTTRCTLKEEEVAALRDELFRGKELLKQLKDFAKRNAVPPVQSIHVVATGEGPIGEGDDQNDRWDNATRSLGHKAAPYCLDRILDCPVLGVTYGRTLSALNAGIATLRGQARPIRNRILLVPLWGEPQGPRRTPTSKVFTDSTKLGSTGLTHELHHILYRESSQETLLSLDFMPCFRPAPKNEFADHFNTIMAYAATISSYTDIFGELKHWLPSKRGAKKHPFQHQKRWQSPSILDEIRPLVDHLDGIITSVGTTEQPGRFFDAEYHRPCDIDLKKLRRGALGDFGGVYLPKKKTKRGELPDREKASPDDVDYVEQLNERWTGAKIDDFKRCAERGRQRGRGGVIVLAVGAMREHVLRICLAKGLINALVLDTECAGALERTTR